ncbi:MAG: sn-glycerol-3-phosphate ABC transporter ATP-binding protein UgpC [Deltaproteobacteria bacterium]|nr:sn-glycerol-3-phosphate ABC transporter ATP-binding protein UgpC [Deltaproteobacteria bacterium]
MQVVRGISLTIPDQEFVVLVGPSGCGKSTTLRMVAGLEDPTAGEILIGGRVVNDVAPKDRDIAMVFQSYALYPHLTVRENLAFGLKMRKLPKPQIEERVAEVARLLGLEGLLDRKPKALSGGQRQRVAMGRAIVRRPQVFLFDEPLSNLDAKLRVQMRTEIARLHQRLQTTVVYVTHDQTEAMTLADRIVVMHGGVIQQEGAPLALYDRPRNRFVAGFLGSPAMNFLAGSVETDGDVVRARAPGVVVELPAAAAARLREGAGRNATLGIRPEHFLLEPDREAAHGAGAATGQLQGRVDVREPMGSEVYLYVETEAGQVVVRAPAHAGVREGESLTLHVAPANLHLFDAQTEESLLQ